MANILSKQRLRLRACQSDTKIVITSVLDYVGYGHSSVSSQLHIFQFWIDSNFPVETSCRLSWDRGGVYPVQKLITQSSNFPEQLVSLDRR